jgi:hypothetical protein
MPTIADSKCGNPLIFVQKVDESCRTPRLLEAIVVCIRPEIGFGSGEPLPPFGTPGFIEVSASGAK